MSDPALQLGFAKQDITPRLGVELVGYSGYLNRRALAVRDRLWARAMAVGDGKTTAVVVSCDLTLMSAPVTAEVRRLVQCEMDLPDPAIMVHVTHTHSGPCVQAGFGWEPDPPYIELLTRRIARACIGAAGNLREARLLHAEVPCEGLGTNRVYDNFNYGRDALRPGFRPARPELTNTTCHVLKAVSGDKVIGFVSCFGCHPVVGGQCSTYLHGDYAGIATGMLEQEYPGAVGLFLQGAEGDINAAACVFGDDLVLEALDVMAGRYAAAARRGLDAARPVEPGPVRVCAREARFSRQRVPLEELQERLAAEQAIIDRPDANDADHRFRMAILRRKALLSLIARTERGESFEDSSEVQGIRFGPVALLAAPLEIFHAIKEDVVAGARAPIPLVMSLTNDAQGYAPDARAASAPPGGPGEYEVRTVPLWKHTLPFANMHAELTEALLAVDEALA